MHSGRDGQSRYSKPGYAHGIARFKILEARILVKKAQISSTEAIVLFTVLSQLIQWASKNPRRVSFGRDYPANA